ncbi:hypothetical protein V7659_27470 [Neobacillus drentensis]
MPQLLVGLDESLRFHYVYFMKGNAASITDFFLNLKVFTLTNGAG